MQRLLVLRVRKLFGTKAGAAAAVCKVTGMETRLQTVSEAMRLPSPAPRPQAIAADGEVLWIGSLETCRLYAIDITHWTVREEIQADGKPYGATVTGDELRVLLSEGEDDRRVIRKCIPGHGFKSEAAIACPGDTGSQLAFDGDRLYVSQWYNKRILSLDAEGNVGSVIDTPHGVCGQVVVGGVFYVLGTDDEQTDRYFLTRVDARGESAKAEDIAHVNFQARGLAYDRSRFWTNHREQHQIVAFTIDGFTP